MPSPLGESSRSECLAGMDMLHEMFERQARRLESQLFQRAQDQQRIEMMQSQAGAATQQVFSSFLQSDAELTSCWLKNMSSRRQLLEPRSERASVFSFRFSW